MEAQIAPAPTASTWKTALQLTAKVLPGNRIVISSPELREGQDVDVILLLPERQESPRESIVQFLDSLPPGPRSYATWEEFEQAFQEERNSWHR